MKTPNYPASFYAQLFHVTERRIQQLAKDGVIPKSGRGKYPLITTIQGYVRFLQERSMGGEVSTDIQTERQRLISANADKAEIEVKVLKGELIPLDLVTFTWQAMAGAVRSRMLSVPNKSAHVVSFETDVHVIEELLTSQVHEALDELSETGIPNEVEQRLAVYNDGLEVAAEVDGESMGG